MKHRVRSLFLILLCFSILCGNIGTVQAAKASRPKLTNLTFDMDYYYNTYPDVQAAVGYDYNNLYNHYITYGLQEGRSGSAEFCCLVYRNNYADLQAAFGNDYSAYCVHYENYGKAEGRSAAGNGTGLAASAAQPVSQPVSNIIGSYTTTYDPNIPRATNVIVAASRINGVVLQPGQSFSFHQTILPRSAANGYVEAPVIVGKKYVPGIGGGICQVSSTLYAAMLSAGLPATERHPHSLVVNYIPVGMDATISGSVKDLKFTNVFAEPICIHASADYGVLTVSISK